MINDPTLAAKVSEALAVATNALDESIATVQNAASENEFVAYRKAVASVLGEMCEILRPLWNKHRHLAPPGYFEDTY